MKYAFIACAVLSGCAVPAAQVSDFELCAYTMRGGQDAFVAQTEANRRGLDCRPLYPAIIARQQAQSQALQNAANYFNRPMTPIPNPVSCYSRQVGNTVQTECR